MRLLADTSRLRRGMSRGASRKDRHDGVAVFLIALSLLREPAQDGLPLAEHFLASDARREGKPGCTLSAVVEPVETAARDGESLRETMGRIEALLIRRTLDAHRGRRTATARRLGITREGLYKEMRRYGIE